MSPAEPRHQLHQAGRDWDLDLLLFDTIAMFETLRQANFEFMSYNGVINRACLVWYFVTLGFACKLCRDEKVSEQ